MTNAAAPCQTENVTGMARSVLSEISGMLQALANNETAGSVDLRSLPLTQADRRQLEDALGRGEVAVELELAGRSSIWETRYAGVWWIRHRGAQEKVSSEEISVCRVPDILTSQPADITAAALRLQQELSQNPSIHPEASDG
ncbi:MAG: hydrogenase expression/formation protein [Xanthomonadales bacterium]|nr:hydrogenase expression/formation protein [Gammaproteobacteria bacterium]MBT8056214.1 hydrogenase expression/formation protein [Gammaproteobacteria bacterium]NNJ78578.1 hydrogenase expression/formation protein [Xanthomonadales bacterium]NNL04284.1 hydrogenase expression/formation protein [Xanthomonadales bacterium]